MEWIALGIVLGLAIIVLGLQDDDGQMSLAESRRRFRQAPRGEGIWDVY